MTEPLLKSEYMKNEKLLKRCNDSGIMSKPFIFRSLVNFEEESFKSIINRIGVAQRRKRGCKSGDY